MIIVAHLDDVFKKENSIGYDCILTKFNYDPEQRSFDRKLNLSASKILGKSYS